MKIKIGREMRRKRRMRNDVNEGLEEGRKEWEVKEKCVASRLRFIDQR